MVVSCRGLLPAQPSEIQRTACAESFWVLLCELGTHRVPYYFVRPLGPLPLPSPPLDQGAGALDFGGQFGFGGQAGDVAAGEYLGAVVQH